MIDLSTLKPGDTTKFEDELREAFAVLNKPNGPQQASARYEFTAKHSKSYEQTFEDAAALLLDILPELRGMDNPSPSPKS